MLRIDVCRPFPQHALLALVHLESGSREEAEQVVSTAVSKGLGADRNVSVAQWLVCQAGDSSAICPAHLQSAVMRRSMDVLFAHRLAACARQ